MIADRRATYAQMLAESGDHAAAADLMAQALELVPGWAAGWDLLGSYRQTAGDLVGAIDAYKQVLAIDGEGIFGAALKLGALGAMSMPPAPVLPYVEALFDSYADRFDSALVEKLGYQVPGLLQAMLDDVRQAKGATMLARALDLGCGTGLMGERLRAGVSHLTGVDLSAQMVAQSAAKGFYDALAQGDLTAHLSGIEAEVDLITAADVFMYCGVLDEIFHLVHHALVPGGLFGFSVELLDAEAPLMLRDSLRFAHGQGAIEAGLRAAGLEIVARQIAPIRMDRGAPITGLLVVARRPGVAEHPVAGPMDSDGAVTVLLSPLTLQ